MSDQQLAPGRAGNGFDDEKRLTLLPAAGFVIADELRYRRPLPPGERVQLPPQPGGADVPAGPFRVTGASGASIVMQADTPLVRTAIWSMRRTVAVEPFVAINVAPGGEQRWSWRYTFATKR